jgi:hypothetical protein
MRELILRERLVAEGRRALPSRRCSGSADLRGRRIGVILSTERRRAIERTSLS